MKLDQSIKNDTINIDTQIIKISSVGNPINAQTRKNANIDAFLEKPVKQTQLHQCLASVLGSALPKRTKANNHTPSEARPHAIHDTRILIAEDNEVNKKVMLLVLEDLGYTADTVSNGKKAIAAL